MNWDCRNCGASNEGKHRGDDPGRCAYCRSFKTVEITKGDPFFHLRQFIVEDGKIIENPHYDSRPSPTSIPGSGRTVKQ